jgi:hypothetical protein
MAVYTMEMRKPTHQIVDAPHAMMEMNATLTTVAPTHAKVCSVVHIIVNRVADK